MNRKNHHILRNSFSKRNNIHSSSFIFQNHTSLLSFSFIKTIHYSMLFITLFYSFSIFSRFLLGQIPFFFLLIFRNISSLSLSNFFLHRHTTSLITKVVFSFIFLFITIIYFIFDKQNIIINIKIIKFYIKQNTKIINKDKK